MKKSKVYRYLGRNGMITTPIVIDGVDPIIMYRLIADKDKVLTNGDRKVYTIDVFDDDLNNWYEIPRPDMEE